MFGSLHQAMEHGQGVFLAMRTTPVLVVLLLTSAVGAQDRSNAADAGRKQATAVRVTAKQRRLVRLLVTPDAHV